MFWANIKIITKHLLAFPSDPMLPLARYKNQTELKVQSCKLKNTDK